MKRSFLYVTNVLAPYRVELHNKLYSIMKKSDIYYKVVFMAKTEDRRKWNVKKMINNIQFPYRIYKVYKFKLNNNHEVYFNPGIIINVFKGNWDYVLIGGWDKLTTIFLSLLPKNYNYKKIMRPESNMYSITNKSVMYNVIRKMVVRACDLYAVPGQNTIQLLKSIDRKTVKKRIIILPNIINNTEWIKKIEEAKKEIAMIKKKYGVQDKRRIYFIPARLSKEKGVYNFITCIAKYIKNDEIILCAGNGPDKTKILKFTNDNKLNKQIKLLGFIPEYEIHELYALVDIFILPSFKDPNPLSVIESVFAGLPLLVSKYVGNVPELAQNTNAWIFNPHDRKDVVKKFLLSQNAGKEELKNMGKNSLDIAYKYNDMDKMLNQFVNNIKNL